MEHRERILAAIRHEPVDRVPTDMWATVEVQEKLFGAFQINSIPRTPPDAASLTGDRLSRGVEATLELFDKLDIDGIINIKPPYVGPPLREQGSYSENEWGMGWRDQQYDGGLYREQACYPLAEAETIADLHTYHWPDPDWYDYDALPALAAQCGGRAVCCGYTAPFYYHNMLRGLELSLMDPLVRPDFTHHLIQHISDFFDEYHRRSFEAGRGSADITQVTDDYGSQQGLLIGSQEFDEFYRGPTQRAIDLAKSYGLIVFHHDDGDIRPLLPTLVEMGIDVLNPIQWRCGDWDLAALKADYGEALCFHGGVDNQQTLPFGSPDDVRAEVERLIGSLASDRTGLIIAPCHNLQANTPIENIIAMYEAAQEFGAF